MIPNRNTTAEGMPSGGGGPDGTCTNAGGEEEASVVAIGAGGATVAGGVTDGATDGATGGVTDGATGGATGGATAVAGAAIPGVVPPSFFGSTAATRLLLFAKTGSGKGLEGATTGASAGAVAGAKFGGAGESLTADRAGGCTVCGDEYSAAIVETTPEFAARLLRSGRSFEDTTPLWRSCSSCSCFLRSSSCFWAAIFASSAES
mmetsp:Transcript_65889/g.134093  ORF Transcript_65889/g.134093 Transcript_65889/m.134093 type:complete len:205 (-) Transcript_65889:315-929(-)